jgi:hypothetical protein
MSKSQITSLTEQRGRDLADIEYLKVELARTGEQPPRMGIESAASAMPFSVSAPRPRH